MFDLRFSDEQEQLVAAYQKLLDRECSSSVVRAHEDQGYAPELWKRVAALGGLDMAVPLTPGADGHFLDAVLVNELLGAYLAPVPLAEAIAAARLLAALAALGSDPAERLLGETLASQLPLTLSPRPVRDGVLRFVPAGEVAEVVLARDGDRLVALRGGSSAPYPKNLGSLPVADRRLDGELVEVAQGSRAAALFDDAILEWRALTAGQLSGAGQRALAIGVAYTKERRAFGVPIASFQTIAHRLADVATALDGAQLLTRKAGWAIDQSTGSWRSLAQMALVAGTDAAQRATDEVLHFHGGYGFMLEYDIQLYFRRVKAWSLQQGDPARALATVADLLWGPAPAQRA